MEIIKENKMGSLKTEIATSEIKDYSIVLIENKTVYKKETLKMNQ